MSNENPQLNCFCPDCSVVTFEHYEGFSSRSEYPLKIVAHNNLIGRIIGKGGATLKKIMEDTNTKVTVSSYDDIKNFNLDRVIYVEGLSSVIISFFPGFTELILTE